jgi:hypothetical protein
LQAKACTLNSGCLLSAGCCLSGRTKIFESVKQRFPDVDPVEKVLDWVEELSQTRVVGSKEANALGIEGFNHDFLFAFESLLKNQLTRTRAGGEGEYDYNERGDLEQISEKIRRVPLFKSLVS